MGLLNLFSNSRNAAVQRLPAGTMTVDRFGNIITTTVSSAYSTKLLNDIATEVLRLFREARHAQIPLAEFRIQFASLEIVAREMRGGAIVYLKPDITFKTSAST
ncbi:MAG: hypothetical protein QOD03_1451 [Verrucomicrobiota bacterium]|jgi:hypothetical protein